MREASDAGHPQSLFAAHSAVAALLLPPPIPPSRGVCLSMSHRKYFCTPVFFRNTAKALATRFRSSRGTEATLHDNISCECPTSRTSKIRLSPSPKAWNTDANSWNPSSLLRVIRRNKFVFAGLKSLRLLTDESWFVKAAADAPVIRGHTKMFL